MSKLLTRIWNVLNNQGLFSSIGKPGKRTDRRKNLKFYSIFENIEFLRGGVINYL